MAENRTDLGTVLLIGLAILVLVPVFAMGFGISMMGGGMYGSGMGEGFGTVGILVSLALLLVLLGAGYLLVRHAVGNGTSGDAALEELRNAYARGDFSDEEFETRRRKLQND